MKKRLIAILLAVLTALSVMIPAANAESDAWIKLVYTDGSLNLRSGPGKNYDSIGYVKHGDGVEIFFGDSKKDSEGEEWTHIKVDRTGKAGYVKTKYLSTKPVSGGAASATAKVYVGKNGGSLKLRKGPGTNYGVAGYVQHGEKISVESRGSEWSKVKVVSSGKVGYIKTKYIYGSGSTGTDTRPASYQLGVISTKTSGGMVNIRKGAGTSYASVGKVGRGVMLKITGEDGKWYKVTTSNGLTGYVSKSYVSLGVSAQTTANLNMRKGAGSSYGRVTTLSKGASLTVYSVSGNWAYVRAGKNSGYVSMNFVKVR